jgi:hypothetical protein
LKSLAKSVEGLVTFFEETVPQVQDGHITKRKRKVKDPDAPKLPLSSYILFCQSVRDEVKSEHPEQKATELMVEMGERWRNLSDKEREVAFVNPEMDQKI